MSDSAAGQKTYPSTSRFDDVEITFRPMTEADGEKIIAFARSLPEDDLLFLRMDITQPEVVETWIRRIESGRTVTLLAEDGDRLVGYCTLHQSGTLWTRHLGEIRLQVGPDYRNQGIGGQLTRRIFQLASHLDLHKLVVRMMSSQRPAQSLFHHLGFIPEALLHDWVIDRNGRTHDLIVMSREVEEAG